jgi:hypothetical protein
MADALERCPKCRSKEIMRSHRRNPLERALSVFVLPWRCSCCYARFYRPRWVKARVPYTGPLDRFHSSTF